MNRCTPRGIRRAPRTGVEPVSLRRQRSCDTGRITRHGVASPAGLDRNCTESTTWTKYSDDHGAKRSAPAWTGLGTGASSVRPRGQARGDVRGSNPSTSVHSRPSSQTSNVTMMRAMRHGGLSWARTTFFRASTGRYHSTSSQPVSTPGAPGTLAYRELGRTRRPPVESRRSSPLEDGSVRCHAEPSSGIEPEPPEYETGARPVELQGQVAPAEGVEPSRVRLTAGCPTVRPRWNDRGAARARRRDDPRIGASTLRAASRTTRAIPLTSQLIGAEFSRNRAPCRRTSPFVAFTSALQPP